MAGRDHVTEGTGRAGLFRADTSDLNRSGNWNGLPGELVVDQGRRKCGYRLERRRLGQCSLMVEKAT